METDEKKTSTSRLSTARSRELGEELRRARHRAGMSSGFVAEALGWSQGKLSKLETGTRGTSPWEIGILVGRLGADKETRDRILALATEPDTGSFLRVHDQGPDRLVALWVHERMALTITAYEPLTVPSLAQTEDYAYALTDDRALARARAARQDRLRPVDGAETILYVHEAALGAVVGGPGVMRDQMLRLTLVCGWARVWPRVVPVSTRSRSVLANPATVLTFAAQVGPLAYVEVDAATVFHDDPKVVARYQAKMRHLESLALSPTESRDVFARWVDVYDRATR